MEAEAAREGMPISDPEVGRLLEILARATGARSIVEVGTAIGYGALCLARGAPEARVVTIDTDPARLARARGYLERAGVAERVELWKGRRSRSCRACRRASTSPTSTRSSPSTGAASTCCCRSCASAAWW